MIPYLHLECHFPLLQVCKNALGNINVIVNLHNDSAGLLLMTMKAAGSLGLVGMTYTA